MVGARVALAAIALDLLALDSARQHLEACQADAREIGAFLGQIVAGLLATVYVAQNDLAAAEAWIDSQLSPGTPMETRGQRLAWAARAELALASGQPAQAQSIAERLIGASAGRSAASIPRLGRLLGEALLAQGLASSGERALLAADMGARERALRPLRWRIQADLGRLYHSQGQRKRAESAFATARGIVEQLASDIPDEDLRAAFLHAASAQLPRPGPPTPRQATRDTFDGLTTREREVAALVALGQSNREIAATLVLSERTVATHISNILGKLNIATRAQIAAWATDKGLRY
jgi:DNA-binding CsgD family transcriptional regulator